MDTAWIQIFVLMLSECVAPAGKTVCQERELELQFLTRNDCEIALEQLVTLKGAADTVIVDRGRSRCAPSAAERRVFASLDDVRAALGDAPGWRNPQPAAANEDGSRAAHEQRLAELKSCEETDGVPPCKVGDIIVEAESGDPVDVWRTGQK